MFQNSGAYAKTLAALFTYLSGAIPVVIMMHGWKPVVSYLVPGILGVLIVYLVPNKQPDPPLLPVTIQQQQPFDVAGHR